MTNFKNRRSGQREKTEPAAQVFTHHGLASVVPKGLAAQGSEELLTLAVAYGGPRCVNSD